MSQHSYRLPLLHICSSVVKIHIGQYQQCSLFLTVCPGVGGWNPGGAGERCLCAASFAVFLAVFLGLEILLVSGPWKPVRTGASALPHPSLKAVGIAGFCWRGGIKNKGAKDEEVTF